MDGGAQELLGYDEPRDDGLKDAAAELEDDL